MRKDDVRSGSRLHGWIKEPFKGVWSPCSGPVNCFTPGALEETINPQQLFHCLLYRPSCATPVNLLKSICGSKSVDIFRFFWNDCRFNCLILLYKKETGVEMPSLDRKQMRNVREMKGVAGLIQVCLYSIYKTNVFKPVPVAGPPPKPIYILSSTEWNVARCTLLRGKHGNIVWAAPLPMSLTDSDGCLRSSLIWLFNKWNT